jgi:hypothetical protein
MSQRKSDDTAPPTEPTKPGSPPAQRRRVMYWDDPGAPQPPSPEQFDRVAQEMADTGKPIPNLELIRFRLEQARELWRQGQDRARQARRIEELEKRLAATQTLAETTASDIEEARPRLKATRAMEELGERGREVRAQNLEAQPWRICAKAAILAANKDSPALEDHDLIKVAFAALQTARIKPPSRKTVKRLVTKLKESGTIPPLPQDTWTP